MLFISIYTTIAVIISMACGLFTHELIHALLCKKYSRAAVVKINIPWFWNADHGILLLQKGIINPVTEVLNGYEQYSDEQIQKIAYYGHFGNGISGLILFALLFPIFHGISLLIGVITSVATWAIYYMENTEYCDRNVVKNPKILKES